MIRVSHLSKRYGDHTAVSDISFHIEKGVIYGFLGPNGAGKSTTMNILTGCLSATAGEVMILGHNIEEEPLKAKQHIGYLPEIPPVYMDMTPREYLLFVLEAKNVPKKDRAMQLASAMEKTGVTPMQHRLIRNLSKGYRQRVGIAQALLGDPEIIILDEPTVGLDPKQIIEIRELIRELGKSHTVILSSHILSEVQSVCEKVLIISGGRLLAVDTAENLARLLSGHEKMHLTVAGDAPGALHLLESLPDCQILGAAALENGETGITLRPLNERDIRKSVFDLFAASGLSLLEMHTEKASLEDVFLTLTANVDEKEAQTE